MSTTKDPEGISKFWNIVESLLEYKRGEPVVNGLLNQRGQDND